MTIKSNNKKCLPEIIPGHLYLDDKGEEIIFIGFGNIRNDVWKGIGKYIFIKKSIWDDRLANGNFTPTLDVYKNYVHSNHATYLFSLILSSKKCRNLTCDLGKFFPEDFFWDKTIIEDNSPKTPYNTEWRITTK